MITFYQKLDVQIPKDLRYLVLSVVVCFITLKYIEKIQNDDNNNIFKYLLHLVVITYSAASIYVLWRIFNLSVIDTNFKPQLFEIRQTLIIPLFVYIIQTTCSYLLKVPINYKDLTLTMINNVFLLNWVQLIFFKNSYLSFVINFAALLIFIAHTCKCDSIISKNARNSLIILPVSSGILFAFKLYFKSQ